jgi:hypothetical protein
MNLSEIISWRDKYVKQKYEEEFMNQIDQFKIVCKKDPDETDVKSCYYITKIVYNENIKKQNSIPSSYNR